jgi:hypothetical protein
MCTVCKIGLILRPIELRTQKQFSIACKLRRYDIQQNKKPHTVNVIISLTRHALRKLNSTGVDRSSGHWVSNLVLNLCTIYT